MSAIRTLLLGVLVQQGPKHGYEIRQELESWNAEQWANIAYGSIYFSLKKMTQEGLIKILENTDDEKPGRILYEVTEVGKNQFMNLLREQWWELKPIIDPFQVALTFMNCMPKDEIILALKHKADNLRANIKSMTHLIPTRVADKEWPRHITENFRLATAHMEAELKWIETAIKKVKNNELP
ncbi:MAG: PadR family transcriptional regulator [Candidatus Babeliales bacterium]